MAYQVIVEPGVSQLRELESPGRSENSYEFVGTFSCAQIDLRKAREREIAELDEKSTSSGIAVPYARQIIKARTGETKGRHLRPRLVQKLESTRVQKKKKKVVMVLSAFCCSCRIIKSVEDRFESLWSLKWKNILKIFPSRCVVMLSL